MGKKGSWFSAVKKVLTPESKEKKDQEPYKSKKRWFRKSRRRDSVSSSTEMAILPSPPEEELKLTAEENGQNKHAYSVALATAVVAEAAVAAAEVVRLTAAPCFSGKSQEEIAAIKIQTAFRGYLARRALRALRGLVRLKSLIQGQSVRRQATTTLRCMQTLARVQSQIRARRIRMSEENHALQRQLQLKHEKELESLRASMGEEWDDSTRSKEQIEANIQNRQEAAVRRERALAYAFSHQQMWKNSSKSANPSFMDANNPQWGWSWLERWMAARPWETRAAIHKELSRDCAFINSSTNRSMSVSEITKSYARHQSPCTPPSKPVPSQTGGSSRTDDDWRSVPSVQSERFRRHSIAGSSARDDESLASSPAFPSYMAPTQSAKAKSRLPSPLGLEKNGTPEKESFGSAKKKLSFSPSSAPAGPRRFSGPPKMERT